MPSPTPTDPPTPPEAVSEPATMRGSKAAWKSWFIAGVITAALVGGGFFLLGNRSDGSAAATVAANGQPGANAATEGGRPPGAAGRSTRGEVTEVDGSKLTVRATDPQGATSMVVVETSAETQVTESLEGELADLKTGDTVMVTGEETSGSITATSINAGEMGLGGNGGEQRRTGDFEPPEGFQPPAGRGGGTDGATRQRPADGQRPGGFTTGEIISIGDSKIEIESPEGETVTVTTTPETTVRVTETRTVGDIEVGDTITATGETSDDVLKAAVIRIGDQGFGGRGGRGSPNGRPGAPPGTAGS